MFNSDSLSTSSRRLPHLLIVAICTAFSIGFVATAETRAQFSFADADFNDDPNLPNQVNSIELGIFLNENLSGATGPGLVSDIDGDNYAGVLCDGSLIATHFGNATGSFTTSSTATATATYSPSTGTGTVTIFPSNTFEGLTGVYLVNASGGISTGAAFSNTEITDAVPAAPGLPGPFGFGPSAESVSFYRFDDQLGGSEGGIISDGAVIFPPGVETTTFNVDPSTPVTDLNFYFQRQGIAPFVLPITDTDNNVVHSTTMEICVAPVPEPTGALMVAMTLLFSVAAIRKRNRR